MVERVEKYGKCYSDEAACSCHQARFGMGVSCSEERSKRNVNSFQLDVIIYRLGF